MFVTRDDMDGDENWRAWRCCSAIFFGWMFDNVAMGKQGSSENEMIDA